MRDSSFPEYHVKTSEEKTVCHEAKVVHFDDLALMDPFVDPIETFLEEHSAGMTSFVNEVKPGLFALVVDKAHASYFREGAMLLVATSCYPKNGDTVIAKIRKTDALLLAIYHREGDQISLIPLDGGAAVSWDCSQSKGYLLWIYPLLEAHMDLSADAEGGEENH